MNAFINSLDVPVAQASSLAFQKNFQIDVEYFYDHEESEILIYVYL